MNPTNSQNKDDSNTKSNVSIVDPEVGKISRMSEYIKLNMLGFQNFRLKEFKYAKQNYNDCLSIAKELDEIKYAETLTNYAITLYFLGKFAECLDQLEAASRITDRYYKKGEPKNIAQIHIRVNCNLCLTCLALNKIKEAVSYNFNVIEIINKESNTVEKLSLLKEVVYIYFRIESLQKYYDNNQKAFSEEEDSKMKNMEINNKDNNQLPNKENPTTQRLISKTLFLIHKFLRENDFAGWIKILAEDIEHFKEISNIPGYVFALLNHTVSIYMQSGKIESAKNQINTIIKNLRISGRIKPSDKILNDWKGKIEAAMEIYRELLKLEENLTNEINSQDENALQNKNNSNRVFMRIIIKHAINFLNNSEEFSKSERYNDLKSQLDIALKLIEIKEIDLSNIDIFSIDSEITKSLKNLFMNLTLIKNKYTLKKYFKLYMSKSLGYDNIFQYRSFFNATIRYKNLEVYKEQCLKKLIEGDTLIKINFSSSGKKEHFYNVVENDVLRIFETKSSKSCKKLSFANEIKQIKYGVKSQNLKSRFKEFKTNTLTKPWLFLSIITNKRSVDLCLRDDQINDWFFGLNYFIRKNQLPVHIMTNSGFAIKKLKLKLLQKLKELLEKEDDKNVNRSIDLFIQMKKYLKNNQLGLDFISFAKVLLLYIKLFNVKLEVMAKK